MEKFKREMMSIELHFTCVSQEYFFENLIKYYDFLVHKMYKSKSYGLHGKYFYKLKSVTDIINLGLDKSFYLGLPCFICVSRIY